MARAKRTERAEARRRNRSIVGATENLDFEWHEDILYRRPEVDMGDEVEFWHVEAVRTDDPDTVIRAATFGNQVDAREFIEAAATDLAEMTKSEFESAYLDAGELGDTGPE